MYSLNVTTSRSRRWPAYHAAAQELVFHNCPFQDTSQGCTHTRGLQYRDRHNLTQQPTYFSLPGIYIPGAHPSHMPLPEAAMDHLVLRQSDCMIIAGLVFGCSGTVCVQPSPYYSQDIPMGGDTLPLILPRCWAHLPILLEKVLA